MNTTPGAPTDAQIIEAARFATDMMSVIGGDEYMLRIGRAVLSLHPAPSAALAAPVASHEPVAWLIDPGAGSAMDKLQRTQPSAAQLADINLRGGSVTPLAPIAPSPPTTPPAAEPGASESIESQCGNCGKPASDAERYITEQDEEGDWFCSEQCYDQHAELGCPHEHHNGYRHPKESGRLIACEGALRSLASWLGSGGYNAPEVDASIFEAKIRDGVENLRALATPPAPSTAQGLSDAEIQVFANAVKEGIAEQIEGRMFSRNFTIEEMAEIVRAIEIDAPLLASILAANKGKTK